MISIIYSGYTPEEVKVFLGRDLYNATLQLTQDPQKDSRKTADYGKQLWTTIAGPLVDYLYAKASGSAPPLQIVTDVGNTTTNDIIAANIKATDNLQSSLDVYTNVDGSNVTGHVYFHDSGSGIASQGAWMGYDQDDHKFTISKPVQVPFPSGSLDATNKNYVDILTVDVYSNEQEPTGFVNRADSSINITDGTRTFEIKTTGVGFDYYLSGIKTMMSGSAKAFPDTEGNYYVYFDLSGKLNITQTFSINIITIYAYVATFYWDATNNETIYFGEERHGITMDGTTHIYLHTTRGTQWLSGLTLNTFDIDGSGNDATAAQFGYTSGEIADEDIRLSIAVDTAPAQIPIFYKDGASGDWRRTTTTNFPLIYDGHPAGYTPANGRVGWNEFTGGAWQLTEVGNNDFVLTHYFATNDPDQPVIGICGQADYGTIGTAREGATTEINNLITSGLPFTEFKAIATVIFQTANGYSNIPQARVRSTDTGDEYIDWRFTEAASSAGTQINDHSQLTNLDTDDHFQYPSGSRSGDADFNFVGDWKVDQNIFINSNGPEGDGYLYFYDSGSATTKHFKWVDSENYFHINASLHTDSDIWSETHVRANINLYCNNAHADDDARIYFCKPTVDHQILKWDKTSDRFEFNEKLHVVGPISTDDADDDITAAGNLRTYLDVQGDGNFRVNYAGGDGDSFVYFYENSSSSGAYLMWDDDPGTFKFSHILDMASNKITNVTDPAANQDAATKKYVDDNIGGGWADDGAVVRLTTAGDVVSIGTATARGKLAVRKDSSTVLAAADFNSDVEPVLTLANLNVADNMGAMIKFFIGGAGTTAFGIIGRRVSADNSQLEFWIEDSNTVTQIVDIDAAGIQVLVSGSTFKETAFQGVVDLTNFNISNVADPVDAQDVATKNYVDTFGGAASGSLENFHINIDGGDGDSYLYFYETTATGRYLKWDDGDSQFELNSSLKIGGFLYVDGAAMYLRHPGGDTDQYIYFYEGGSPTGAYIKWNNTTERHDFSHGGEFNGPLNVVGLCQCDEFRLDKAPVTEVVAPTDTVEVNINGSTYKLLIRAV